MECVDRRLGVGMAMCCTLHYHIRMPLSQSCALYGSHLRRVIARALQSWIGGDRQLFLPPCTIRCLRPRSLLPAYCRDRGVYNHRWRISPLTHEGRYALRQCRVRLPVDRADIQCDLSQLKLRRVCHIQHRGVCLSLFTTLPAPVDLSISSDIGTCPCDRPHRR